MNRESALNSPEEEPHTKNNSKKTWQILFDHKFLLFKWFFVKFCLIYHTFQFKLLCDREKCIRKMYQNIKESRQVDTHCIIFTRVVTLAQITAEYYIDFLMIKLKFKSIYSYKQFWIANYFVSKKKKTYTVRLLNDLMEKWLMNINTCPFEADQLTFVCRNSAWAVSLQFIFAHLREVHIHMYLILMCA